MGQGLYLCLDSQAYIVWLVTISLLNSENKLELRNETCILYYILERINHCNKNYSPEKQPYIKTNSYPALLSRVGVILETHERTS